MRYFNGKIAVVTGAGSGIGRALAVQLNQQGCQLYISDINEESLAETVGMLPRRDVAADSQLLDVADKAAVHAWADRIAAADNHVDAVVNNAGVALMSTVAIPWRIECWRRSADSSSAMRPNISPARGRSGKRSP